MLGKNAAARLRSIQSTWRCDIATNFAKILGILAILMLALSACAPGTNPIGGRAAQADGTKPAATATPAGTTSSSPTATAIPGSGASSVATPSSGGNTTFNLIDGRSYDPRTTADANYADTGVGKRQTYKLEVPSSMTLLVFGVRVSDGSKVYDRGVLKAYAGPTTVNLDVTDGGWRRVGNDRAPGEACVRIQQHVDNNWLLSSVEVPASWANGCPPLQKFVK